MSSESDTVDDERVRAIVREELQEQSGGVTRREALLGLSGLGALGSGLALGSSDSSPVQSAQAQTAASGQVGQSDQRVDVYGETGDFNAVSTERLTTVNGDTFEDIQRAVNNNSPVILEQGKTYTGDSTVVVDQETDVIAFGATLDYTGAGVAIQTDPENYGQPYEFASWRGGTLLGNSNADAGVELRDSYRARIEFEQIRGFDSGYGIWLNNVDAWSEYNEIRKTTFDNNQRHIHFDPADSDQGGTGSYKATIIENLHFQGPVSGGYGIYCQGGVYDSEIRNIRCNPASDTTMIYMSGAMGGTIVDHVVAEVQNSSGVTLFELGEFGGNPPDIRRGMIHGGADDKTYIENPHGVNIRSGYTGHGVTSKSSGEDAAVHIYATEGSPNRTIIEGESTAAWRFRDIDGDIHMAWKTFGDDRMEDFPGDGFTTGSPISFGDGASYSQRGDPTTDELDAGESMTYTSDGSGTGEAGDLVYAVNDGGTILTSVLAQVSNAT